MFKSKVYFGRIPYDPEDIITHWPGFKVPDHIAQSLLTDYRDTPEAEVLRFKVFYYCALFQWLTTNGKVFRWSVKPRGKERNKRKQKERLLFKSRVCDGFISYDRNDVNYCSDLEWRMPPYIADSLKRDKSSGTLSVFSDEEKNVFYKVEHGIKDTATEVKGKTDYSFGNPFKWF